MSTNSDSPLSRRDALKVGLLAGSAAMLGGCSRVVQHATAPQTTSLANAKLPVGDTHPIVRLLNRTAFGPRPGDVAKVMQLGAAKWLDKQLQPDEEDESILNARMHAVEVFQFSAADLHDLPQDAVLRGLRQAALLRAVYSRHQLRERLVDFWRNHFNIYGCKWPAAYFLPTDLLQVVRTHALGKFPELLRASAFSPAMLIYLDGQQNRGGVPNENYARELLELHTLGVHGGYTQRDITEIARCFSGWTIENRFLHRRGTTYFDESLHDNGAKTVLGHSIPTKGGARDAEIVLDIVANHPATANHIATKICRAFRGDDSAAWIKRLSGIYRISGGDIRAMMRPLLLDEELAEAPPILKRPFDFMVSSLRALEADTDGGGALQTHLENMGQPLYEWPMPDGYPDGTQAWSGSLLARWNFALALTAGNIGGTSVSLRPNDISFTTSNLIERLFGVHAKELSNLPITKLQKHSINESAALLLSSPDFQWR